MEINVGTTATPLRQLLEKKLISELHDKLGAVAHLNLLQTLWFAEGTIHERFNTALQGTDDLRIKEALGKLNDIVPLETPDAERTLDYFIDIIEKAITAATERYTELAGRESQEIWINALCGTPDQLLAIEFDAKCDQGELRRMSLSLEQLYLGISHVYLMSGSGLSLLAYGFKELTYTVPFPDLRRRAIEKLTMRRGFLSGEDEPSPGLEGKRAELPRLLLCGDGPSLEILEKLLKAIKPENGKELTGQGILFHLPDFAHSLQTLDLPLIIQLSLIKTVSESISALMGSVANGLIKGIGTVHYGAVKWRARLQLSKVHLIKCHFRSFGSIGSQQ